MLWTRKAVPTATYRKTIPLFRCQLPHLPRVIEITEARAVIFGNVTKIETTTEPGAVIYRQHLVTLTNTPPACMRIILKGCKPLLFV